MNYFKLGILSLIFLYGCNRTCENEKVGSVDYAMETLSFQAYTAGETLSYINTEGDFKSFEVTLEPNTVSQLCTKVICRPSDPFDSNGCEYVEGPSHYYVLRSDDIFLHFKTGIAMYLAESMLFYDWVEVGVTSDFGNYFGGVITSQNFTDPVLVFENTFLDSELVFYSESPDGNHTDVYALIDEENDAHIYFKKGQGIVSFRITGTTWTLD